MARRIALIGYGAIGRPIAEYLEGEPRAGQLVAVLRQSCTSPLDVENVEALCQANPDLVVEAAGQGPATRYIPEILDRGIDVLMLSVGALARREFEERINSSGPGRLLISTGAVGGLDILKAHKISGSLESVHLTSTISEGAVPADLRSQVVWAEDDGAEDVLLFNGSARDAALTFPQIANVAATVSIASLGLDSTQATIRVQKRTQTKRHVVEAVSKLGSVVVAIESVVSATNPRTSATTPYAVIRFLEEGFGRILVGV